jgi:preprotein translocase subunit Sec61beta
MSLKQAGFWLTLLAGLVAYLQTEDLGATLAAAAIVAAGFAVAIAGNALVSRFFGN